MISVFDAIKSSESEIRNLPKAEREKAINTRRAFYKFLIDAIKVRVQSADGIFNVKIVHRSPSGMKLLPNAYFAYDSETNQDSVQIGDAQFDISEFDDFMWNFIN